MIVLSPRPVRVCVCVCGLWWTQWNWNWLLCEYLFRLLSIYFDKYSIVLRLSTTDAICINITASVNNTRKIRAFSWHAKQAQRGGSRRGWLENVNPLPLYPRERPSVYLVGRWALGPVWTGVENLEPTGVRAPDIPACYSHCSVMLDPLQIVLTLLGVEILVTFLNNFVV